ncbi:hypothetical protein NPIL_324041 [Nephila pilipes]|uniref:Uncharacterized protein n=1 Tax=Nephila pilipes TaxID=299642 RepID=A0A8X6NQJ1_NEPPI|nr:hypothetical protein NPIL_324041 [Nephila pilipes]
MNCLQNADICLRIKYMFTKQGHAYKTKQNSNPSFKTQCGTLKPSRSENFGNVICETYQTQATPSSGTCHYKKSLPRLLFHIVLADNAKANP